MSDAPLNPNKFGARLSCTTCDRYKLPCGRSAPIGLHYFMCGTDCAGYYDDPKPGSLWPNESEADFGYPVADVGTELRAAK